MPYAMWTQADPDPVWVTAKFHKVRAKLWKALDKSWGLCGLSSFMNRINWQTKLLPCLKIWDSLLESRSHCIVQASLEFVVILLPRPPECWDYRHNVIVMPCPFFLTFWDQIQGLVCTGPALGHGTIYLQPSLLLVYALQWLSAFQGGHSGGWSVSYWRCCR